jgi:hypothetical protein
MDEFYVSIHTEDGQKFEPVPAETRPRKVTLKGYEGFDFFAFIPERGWWRITETTTGYAIWSQKGSLKAVIDGAIDRIRQAETLQAVSFAEMVKQAQDDTGVSPYGLQNRKEQNRTKGLE